MAEVSLRSKGGSLTVHGKRKVAEAMYWKGRSFVLAAVLLGKHTGHEYVVLHLMSQGIETILKGALLLCDYDKYRPLLKGRYGHNIEALAVEATRSFGLKPITAQLAAQLRTLCSLYTQNILRYGSFYDVLVDARTIESHLVTKRAIAVIRLADRHLAPIVTGA